MVGEPDGDTYRFVEHVASEYVSATVTGRVRGESASREYRSDSLKTVTNGVKSLLRSRDSLGSRLRPIVEREVGSWSIRGLGGVLLRNWYFRVSGPISIVLTAKGGQVDASVGGFSINTSFKLKQSDLAYLKVNVRTNTIWLDGYYDPFSGIISQVSLSPSANIEIDVDVEGLAGRLLSLWQRFQGIDFGEEIADSGYSLIFDVLEVRFLRDGRFLGRTQRAGSGRNNQRFSFWCLTSTIQDFRRKNWYELGSKHGLCIPKPDVSRQNENRRATTQPQHNTNT